MGKDAKSTRRYHSPLRSEQAARTRADTLEAARRLFIHGGYVSTSMAAVAAAANVSSKTVYLAYGTKAGLLRALWQRVLGGQDDDVPVSERDWYREMAEETDPERRLRLNARNARRVKESAGEILTVISDASPADRDAAELWSLIQSDFHTNQAGVVRSLAEQGALRTDLDPAQATDILWAVNSPEIWRLLVGGRGWTADAYETWIAETACAQLLRVRARSRS